MKVGNTLHWTQRPENAAKVKALSKARWAKKGKKKPKLKATSFRTPRLQLDALPKLMLKVARAQNPEFWRGYVTALKDHDADPTRITGRLLKELKQDLAM